MFPNRAPSTAKSISISGQDHALQLDCKGEGTGALHPTGGAVGGRSMKPRPSIISSGMSQHTVVLWLSNNEPLTLFCFVFHGERLIDRGVVVVRSSRRAGSVPGQPRRSVPVRPLPQLQLCQPAEQDIR